MSNFDMNRRKFIESTGILAAGLLVAPRLMFDEKTHVPIQESPVTIIKNAAATAKINVTKLRGNLSMLEGSGGNILVSYGPDGKLMVDGGIGVSKPNVSAALNGIGKNPLKYLVNTHWHFDHVDGNEWLHEAGAVIVAHENTLKNMSKTTRVDDWDYTFPPAPAGALPEKTFKKKEKLSFNGEEIKMSYYQPAHTDSDISVYFPKADVLHVADIWWNGHYPFIDHNTGGNIKGMIDAANISLQNSSKDTIIIPGHGPVGNRKQLTEYRDMLSDIYDRVRTLKMQGKSVNEVVAAKPTAKYDAVYGTFIIGPDFFTRLVYRSA
ncbi:MBL fold metallo-hydrolase [Flavobacterium beibuense]|uniref:Beta-lactamase domain protein n=1 Tax=Flavobacterium beibuense TaxID=657326 RepID=A0A444WEH4_9FLAO|nr:MBL fold metallo-hydrolase [Flavobacterium beibuense]RYJ44227.1 Beta-lactamase domain protein [Flavobacterium beibuense]